MKKIAFIIGVTLLISCSSTKTYTEQEQQAYQRLKDLVQTKQLKIQSNFARPMATTAFTQVANSGIFGPGNSATNIDIASNSNLLKIQGDSITGYFPFFGEQRFGGSYPSGNNQGIDFRGIPKDYKVTHNDVKHSVMINFKIDDQHRTNEHYNVFITVFPNKRSTIQINSTNRTSIEYSGSVQALKEEANKTL
uniref:DUF4251 domain-containing protein n=1 Tax=Gelidibacter sp. TaxID=2018083 RepID=UPI00404A5D9F